MGGVGGMKKLFWVIDIYYFYEGFCLILWFRIRDLQYKGCLVARFALSTCLMG